MALNSGGGGRSGRGPIRPKETRIDHKQNDGGHEWDGTDPDRPEAYP